MGALHHAVLLLDGEAAHARALDLDVVEEGRTLFALPCPKLEGTRCGIFDRRPSSCGFYRCQLLQHLDRGEISLDKALEKVSVARAQFEEVRKVLPPGMSLRQARAFATGRETFPEAGPELRLKVTALTYYLDQHFMNDDDGKYFVVSDVSSQGNPK